MRLLLINANTSAGVTDLCAAAARRVAAPGTEIVPLTARFGARIIESRAENAIAAHAVLELLAEHCDGADACLLAVSYDTALAAARDLAGFPVLGITQASLLTASLLGGRMGLVTFGTPWLYRELADTYGVGARVAGVEVIQASARDAYGDPGRVRDEVAAAAGRLIDGAGAEVIVLTGAALAGMAAEIGERLTVPVIDGVTCGVPLCESLARLGVRRAPTPGGSAGSGGLSPALDAALYPPRRPAP